MKLLQSHFFATLVILNTKIDIARYLIINHNDLKLVTLDTHYNSDRFVHLKSLLDKKKQFSLLSIFKSL